MNEQFNQVSDMIGSLPTILLRQSPWLTRLIRPQKSRPAEMLVWAPFLLPESDEIAWKKCTPDQLIQKLREAEIRLGQGEVPEQVCSSLAIYQQRFYRSLKEYGGLRLSQSQRLKGLEHRNELLRRRGVHLSLANYQRKDQAGKDA